MIDFRQICDHLRELGSQPETPEARAEVEAGFFAKGWGWDGPKCVAARVLGHWGGRRSVEQLKGWMLKNYRRKRFNVETSVEGLIAEALAECVEPEDYPWVLDVYFERSHSWKVLELLRKMPLEVTRDRAVAEIKHESRDHRYKAMDALIEMRFPDRIDLIATLRDDPDKYIRDFARDFIRYHEESSWLK